MTSFELLIDGQFGSTGKGLFAGWLARHHNPDVLAMAPSPNAGHTLVDGDIRLVHKMLPLGIFSASLQAIVLGPGSILNLDYLQAEIENLQQLDLLGKHIEIYVHRNAAVVLPEHREAEANGGTAPGSTRQGVGAAQAARILRRPDNSNVVSEHQYHPVFEHLTMVDTPELQSIYLNAQRVQIEGCQGYSLSVFHGMYPHVTCRDVTTAALLSDCGVPMPSMRSMHVYGAFRTYPIRVANRPESGEWSGPTYSDSFEIDFSDLGVEQELTTVTKLPRRVFTFSENQAIEACVQNRIDSAFLNFAQYPPDFATLRDIWLRLNDAARVGFVGFGPSVSDVYRIGAPGIANDHLESLYERYRRASS